MMSLLYVAITLLYYDITNPLNYDVTTVSTMTILLHVTTPSTMKSPTLFYDVTNLLCYDVTTPTSMTL